MRSTEIVILSLEIWLGIVCLLLTVSSYRFGESWGVRCERDMDAQFIKAETEDDET